MAFKRPKQQPSFATLKSTLAQTKQTEHPLYQTIQLLIERLMQFQGITVEQLGDINNSINDILSIVNTVADKNRTYVTVNNETLNLPNSRRLVAGLNITFDLTNPGQFIINAAGGGGSNAYYDSPLSDGNEDEAQLIFANGDPIICQVPNVP